MPFSLGKGKRTPGIKDEERERGGMRERTFFFTQSFLMLEEFQSPVIEMEKALIIEHRALCKYETYFSRKTSWFYRLLLNLICHLFFFLCPFKKKKLFSPEHNGQKAALPSPSIVWCQKCEFSRGWCQKSHSRAFFWQRKNLWEGNVCLEKNSLSFIH